MTEMKFRGGAPPLKVGGFCRNKLHILTEETLGHYKSGKSGYSHFFCKPCRTASARAHEDRRRERRRTDGKYASQWLNRSVYTLECKHTVVYRTPLPNLGEHLWCPRCVDFREARRTTHLDKVREVYSELGRTDDSVPGDGEEDL